MKSLLKSFSILTCIILFSTLLFGCKSSVDQDKTMTPEQVSEEWCEYLADGIYHGKTNDGVGAYVKFGRLQDSNIDSYGFHIEYNFMVDGKYSVMSISSFHPKYYNYPIAFSGTYEDIKPNKAIKLFPGRIEFGDRYLPKNDGGSYDMYITYLSDNKIKLEFPSANSVLNKIVSIDISDQMTSIVLSKSNGFVKCYDSKASYNSFTDHEKKFIDVDLNMGEGLKIADQELLSYFIKHNTSPYLDMEGLNETGSVFKIDLNMDGEEDICGYFTNEHSRDQDLLFKIFLNSGISYDEVYSIDLNDDSSYGRFGVIMSPDTLNGKPIINCKIPDKGGYSLFYNKLSGKIDQKMGL